MNLPLVIGIVFCVMLLATSKLTVFAVGLLIGLSIQYLRRALWN